MRVLKYCFKLAVIKLSGTWSKYSVIRRTAREYASMVEGRLPCKFKIDKILFIKIIVPLLL